MDDEIPDSESGAGVVTEDESEEGAGVESESGEGERS